VDINNVTDNINLDENVIEIETELVKYGILLKENSKYMINSE